jgi:GntR family transcriptional regulator/MocR family aminotransferase
LDGRGPLYEQLARVLKRAILEGRFAAGKRLPATRALSKELGLSRNTVLGAYDILCAEQLATARERSGTHVIENVIHLAKGGPPAVVAPPSRYTERMRRLNRVTLGPRQPAPRYDLLYGEPLSDPQLLQAWRRKLAAAALRVGPRYPDPSGFPALRRAIAEHVVRRRGINCTEKDVLIVGGTQQAVTLAARVILNEGDEVAVEDPHNQQVVQGLVAHGAQVRHIGADERGLIAAQLANSPPRLICVTPSHQFPSGSILSLERRMELLRIAAKHGTWILEDDYDSEFQDQSHSVAALRSLDIWDRVIYVGSFSKTLFPSLRLGYMVCPESLRTDLCTAKRLDDLGSPEIIQVALGAFIASGQFARYLRRSAAELRLRREALLEGLHRHVGDYVEIRGNRSGAHLVLWLRSATYPQLERLLEIGCEQGLGLYPIHLNYQRRPDRPGLLVGYAGISPSALKAATALLGHCISLLRKEIESSTATALKP